MSEPTKEDFEKANILFVQAELQGPKYAIPYLRNEIAQALCDERKKNEVNPCFCRGNCSAGWKPPKEVRRLLEDLKGRAIGVAKKYHFTADQCLMSIQVLPLIAGGGEE